MVRKPKTLSELVEKQNRFAASRKEAQPGGESVRVLVEGVYVGPRMRSLGHCKVGSIIAVAEGWYVSSLIADGMVTRDLSVTLTSDEGEPGQPIEESPAVPVRGAQEIAGVVEDTELAKSKRRRKG